VTVGRLLIALPPLEGVSVIVKPATHVPFTFPERLPLAKAVGLMAMVARAFRPLLAVDVAVIVTLPPAGTLEGAV
jgi:hypothetical protein